MPNFKYLWESVEELTCGVYISQEKICRITFVGIVRFWAVNYRENVSDPKSIRVWRYKAG